MPAGSSPAGTVGPLSSASVLCRRTGVERQRHFERFYNLADRLFRQRVQDIEDALLASRQNTRRLVRFSGCRLDALAPAHGATSLISRSSVSPCAPLRVHPKIASERLGHSKVGITLDLYSHVLPNRQADAVAQVDDALRAAINKRTKDIG